MHDFHLIPLDCMCAVLLHLIHFILYMFLALGNKLSNTGIAKRILLLLQPWRQHLDMMPYFFDRCLHPCTTVCARFKEALESNERCYVSQNAGVRFHLFASWRSSFVMSSTRVSKCFSTNMVAKRRASSETNRQHRGLTTKNFNKTSKFIQLTQQTVKL